MRVNMIQDNNNYNIYVKQEKLTLKILLKYLVNNKQINCLIKLMIKKK